jgi:hypothetical protein
LKMDPFEPVPWKQRSAFLRAFLTAIVVSGPLLRTYHAGVVPTHEDVWNLLSRET